MKRAPWRQGAFCIEPEVQWSQRFNGARGFVEGGCDMAKKQEGLTYLQVPLPAHTKLRTVVRTNWSGLNKTQVLDTGEMSHEENISTFEAPYLTPSPNRTDVTNNFAGKAKNYRGSKPIGLFGFDNFLVLIYKNGLGVMVAHITDIDNSATVCTGNLGNNSEDKRTVLMFNVFNGNPLDGTYDKRLVIFPDKRSMKFNPVDGEAPDEIPHMPNVVYATVYLSRIFGVGAGTSSDKPDRIFVSGFNDYTNWELDTATEYNPSNAWVSAAQSNVKATGEFTGITTYMNSVVAFKKDYMHEITGNSNPFRVNDVYAEGAMDNRTIAEVDGNLIFVSDDAVKIYTGGNPRVISYKLGINRFEEAVAGNDGRRYYLYCQDEKKKRHLFVYDTLVMQWAEELIDEDVVSFARNSVGFYMLGANGSIYRIDSGKFEEQEWAAETDISAGHTIDIKHVQKVQMLADVEAGSTIKAYLLRDGEVFNADLHKPIYKYKNEGSAQKKVTVRVVPRNTAHWGYKLRLSGTGYSRIYQAEITLKGGGELFA